MIRRPFTGTQRCCCCVHIHVRVYMCLCVCLCVFLTAWLPRQKQTCYRYFLICSVRLVLHHLVADTDNYVGMYMSVPYLSRYLVNIYDTCVKTHKHTPIYIRILPIQVPPLHVQEKKKKHKPSPLPPTKKINSFYHDSSFTLLLPSN